MYDAIGEYITRISILAVPILTAVTFHELAHGLTAYRLGDPTAKAAGRLTLNPLKHLDLVGTLVFLATQMVGWAKPVPVNFYNLKKPRRDMILVSLAGAGANLALAVAFALGFRLIDAFFPVLPRSLALPLALVCRYGVFLNIGLAVFNLIPIPPLDGSKILMGLLPRQAAMAYARLEPYGFIILIVLIFTNAIGTIVFPLIRFLALVLMGG